MSAPTCTTSTAPASPSLGVAVTSNPPALPDDPDVVILDTGLTNELRGFSTGQERESLAFNQMGDAYLTYDTGLAVLNRLATGRAGDTADGDRDRTISGAGTGLVAPKGFDVRRRPGLGTGHRPGRPGGACIWRPGRR